MEFLKAVLSVSIPQISCSTTDDPHTLTDVIIANTACDSRKSRTDGKLTRYSEAERKNGMPAA